MRIIRNSVVKPTDTAANIELLRQAPVIVANAISRGWITARRPLTDFEISQTIYRLGKQPK